MEVLSVRIGTLEGFHNRGASFSILGQCSGPPLPLPKTFSQSDTHICPVPEELRQRSHHVPHLGWHEAGRREGPRERTLGRDGEFPSLGTQRERKLLPGPGAP